MTGPKTSSACAASLALLCSLLGCAPARTDSYDRTFVPPSPAPQRLRFVTPEPPPMRASLELGDTPRFLNLQQTRPRSPQLEALLREADWHYQAGRRLYQQGDENGARREFDRAIDLLLAGPEGPNTRSALDKRLEELVGAIHRLDLAGLGSADIASEPVFEKPPLEDMPELTFPVDPKLQDKVLEEVRATTSQLPLEVNETVLSYINYFSTERGRKILISGLRRAGKYRSLIYRIFDEEGVPQELLFLAQAESGFLPRAVSRKRAMGMWQFMAARGRQYGLTQSALVDERFDFEKSTRAAARHLRDLYHRYGDWYLAMAAYNCGPGVVDKAVERTGYADFWELRRRKTMPAESTNYVPAIIATTIMVKNAKEYGLEDLELDPALEYDTVDLDSPAHLQLIADLTESPVSQIRDLNPALLKNVVPAGLLRVPKGTAPMVAPVIALIPSEKRTAWRAHRIAAGETLGMIAQRYRVSEAAIAAVNREDFEQLAPGDVIVVPAAFVPEKSTVKRAVRKRGTTHTATASRKAPSRRNIAQRPARAAAKRVSYTAESMSPKRSKHASVKR